MSLALTVAAAVPTTMAWSPKVAVVMVICNVLAIAIGKATIKHPSEGPELPMPDMFGGMGLPALLATTSFGHILGVGVILGLGSMGAI
ncbi:MULTISPECIES: photosystem I reaction center subunit PsaK [Cyanophyceae]|uniref:photosystem I reaction center subunit PsaK n=1 Tax=Cyanophyceae TaxID=3028117 RepID=UPI00016DCC8A|nr:MULTISPECIES: photosystem I reaction center subunit PsaK [Cyanophyceae]ACB00379.1 photosystem I reaction center subunit X [Picosynechococcus sp. PCC 7002]ANV91339.1 photosystem I reaction center subunit PsaK [Picosynechococcus sp. PCC 8807]SMH48915.1 photosystem I subunit 10 [Picosynechococcus sp. OG1]SMQ81441.1 photosystem I subunit 10 [Synechococcus sp. 7002]